MTGPNSSELGFQSTGSFTICMQVRFDDLTVTNKTVMDLLSIYTASKNSKSTDGLVLRISGVNRTPVIQTAQLHVVMSNNTIITCAIGNQGNIPLDENTTYCISIVKSPTSIHVYMSTSLNNKIETLVQKVNLKPMDNFTNIPMSVNTNANINGRLCALCGYNVNLSSEDVSRVHKYLSSQQKKVNDTDYVQALAKIKELEEKYIKVTSCPFDKDTCESCKDVTDWQNVLSTADAKCVADLAAFCGKQRNASGICECWSASSKIYSSQRCQNLRNAVRPIQLYDVDRLDKATLEKIKDDYNICETAKPPAVSPPQVTFSPVAEKPPTPNLAPTDIPLIAPMVPVPGPVPPPPPPQPPTPPPPASPASPERKKCAQKPPRRQVGRAKNCRKAAVNTEKPDGFFGWIHALFDV
jgi:hypothetical protein